MDETAAVISTEGPKITQEEILALMERVTFQTVVPEGTTSTFVHAYLDGRFYLASGHSACVSPENFNAEIGYSIAKSKAVLAARDRLWELEGYRLYQSLLEPAPEAPSEAMEGVQLGEQVLFFEQAGGQISNGIIAFVTALATDNRVSLAVFAPNGTHHARNSVTLVTKGAPPPSDLAYFARRK